MKRPLLFCGVSFVLGEILTACDMDSRQFLLLSLFVCLWCVRKRMPLWLAVAFFFILFGAGRNYQSYTKTIEEWEQREEEERVTISGYVEEYRQKEKISYLYLADMVVVIDEEALLDSGTGAKRQLEAGMYIRIEGKVLHFSTGRNQGNYDEKNYYTALGYTKKLQAEKIWILKGKKRWRHRLDQWLSQWKKQYIRGVEQVWDQSQAAMILAMTMGDKASLTEEQREDYQRMGLSHMLAVSGLHLSVIGMGIFRLFRRRFRYVFSGLAGIAGIVLLGMCIGTTPSMLRAMCMFSIHILAQVLGRTYDMSSAAALAAMLLMMDCPYVIYHPGFLLSFLAVTGICTARGISRHSFVTLCLIQLTTLPAVMYFFFEIPLYGILINIVAVPLFGIVLVSGIVSGVTASLFLPLARMSAGIGNIILLLYDKMADIVRQLPWNTIVTGQPSAVKVMCYYVMLAAVCVVLYKYKKRDKKQKIRKRRFILLLIPVCYLFFADIDTSFSITVIDVGQGECLLIHNQNQGAFLIDAGSSNVNHVYSYRILPCLKAKGIAHLDGVFVSHTDDDHINGLWELLEDHMTDFLYLPYQSDKDEKYQKLEELAEQMGVEVCYLEKGMTVIQGDCALKCLYPARDSSNGDKNELSLVLYLTYQNFSMLSVGDLGEEGENGILGDVPVCNVLKVGHHGSKYSSTDAFLDRIQAQEGVISCGERNRYGHPHQEALERLRRHGMQYHITMEMGQIDILIEQSRYQVRTYLTSGRKNCWQEGLR